MPCDKSAPRASDDVDAAVGGVGTGVGGGGVILYAGHDSGVSADTAARVGPGAVHMVIAGGTLHAHEGAVGSAKRYSVLSGDLGGRVRWPDWANVPREDR